VIIGKRTLPRRTFLRGAGACVALPLLDAMVPAMAQSAAPKAQRLGFVYMPNGVARNFDGIDFWTPKTAGKNFELSRIMTPLAPYKRVLTAVSGLAHHEADAQNDGANGDHTRATASWLSGARAKRTEGADVENGITTDQVAAAALGKDTPLPSLELAIDLNFLSGQCENSYACIYMNTIAWTGKTNPLPTENNPRIVFERLFGLGGTTAQRVAIARENRSILDSVTADFTRLARTLGPSDRAHVDTYLQSVREVERRIAAVENVGADAGLPALERPRGIPENFGDHVKLMYELQWLAFQADLTRIVTFMLGRELNFRTYPEIGFNEGHHGVSHHGDRPEQIEKLARLNTYQTDLFAWFLEKLATTPDGDGTLLDHTLYLYGASLSNPNLHAHYDLPITLVGDVRGAGSTLEGNRHLVFPAETPMTNLLLAMLDKVGVPTESLGDSTGPLAI
jgi:hypothetical protein